jgi:hypothetical protein
MMPLEKRVEILEGQMQHTVAVLDRLVVRQEKLDEVMEILAESHIKTQEQLQENARQLRETDELLQRSLREQQARDQAIDARIDKLVSGIGEFIRRQSDSRPN